jgi:hypothetical protein
MLRFLPHRLAGFFGSFGGLLAPPAILSGHSTIDRRKDFSAFLRHA